MLIGYYIGCDILKVEKTFDYYEKYSMCAYTVHFKTTNYRISLEIQHIIIYCIFDDSATVYCIFDDKRLSVMETAYAKTCTESPYCTVDE